MDVNADEVRKTISEHGVDILLHGHTHRPAIHDVEVDDRIARRIVLGDWYAETGMSKAAFCAGTRTARH
jgi:UDP-2,3-diacylglucosamine hydrolase